MNRTANDQRRVFRRLLCSLRGLCVERDLFTISESTAEVVHVIAHRDALSRKTRLTGGYT